jgi:VWFA-related protein
VFAVETAAVVLDVVVRDKKGNAVRDLTASDFEVFEDGAKQTVDSFRIVDVAHDDSPAAPQLEPAPGTPPPAASSPAASSAPAPAPPPTASADAPPASPLVIAFVFDRLSTSARNTAQKAALTYAERGHIRGDLVGVFSIDLALRTLQPLTNDLEAIRRGLERATSQGNTAFASDRETARRRVEGITRADDTLAGLAPGSGADASTAALQASLVAAQQAFDRLELNMLRTFDALERDQQGYASTNGLLAVVNGLRAIPGRKTVVFFSEGLAIPANVRAQFRSVIAAANRANVSIYAMDAGGLRTASGTLEARDEMMQAADRRLRQESTGRSDPSTGAMTKALERNEDLLRLNPEAGLGQLAEETGGFLIRDTNDATRGFRRIEEDMRFHYLLSYSPTNAQFDGRYRTIAVKVRRPGVTVQARHGYYAVRPEVALPVRGYEAPAVAHLDKRPRPDAFPIWTAALSFPETARPGLAPLLVEIPGGAFAWAPQQGGGFRAEFVVVARIKDARGREVDRVSQQYHLAAAADKLEAARRGDILFYKEASVGPGHYTAEAVAYDAIAQTASVRAAAFDVPPVHEGQPRLSSLVLVSRAEKLNDWERDGKNPLQFGEVILYPNMGRPFRKSAPLGFFFSIYDARAARAATIEVRQGERVVARTTSALPAPDAAGRIQHAGALPLTTVAPGEYTLRVSVSDGGTSVALALAKDAPFTVVP